MDNIHLQVAGVTENQNHYHEKIARTLKLQQHMDVTDQENNMVDMNLI